MEAVLRLCTRGILLDAGCVLAVGDAKVIVPSYLHRHSSSPRVVDLLTKARPNDLIGKVRLTRLSPSEAGSNWSIPFGQELSLDLSIDVQSSVKQVEVVVGIYSTRGFEVLTWTNRCSDVLLQVRPGTNTFRIVFQHLRLLPGRYILGIGIIVDRGYEDAIDEAVDFEVVSSLEAAKIKADDPDIFNGVLVPSAMVSILD